MLWSGIYCSKTQTDPYQYDGHVNINYVHQHESHLYQFHNQKQIAMMFLFQKCCDKHAQAFCAVQQVQNTWPTWYCFIFGSMIAQGIQRKRSPLAMHILSFSKLQKCDKHVGHHGFHIRVHGELCFKHVTT